MGLGGELVKRMTRVQGKGMTLGSGGGELGARRNHWALVVIMARPKAFLRMQRAQKLGLVGVDPSRKMGELRGAKYGDRKGTMRDSFDMNNVSGPIPRGTTHLPKVIDPLLIP
jgi:hypothetical protein